MRKFAFIVILISVAVSTVIAQRRINPVDRKPTTVATPLDKDKNKVKHKKDTAMLDSGFVDSTVIVLDTVSKKMIYPLLHGVTFGINIWDPVMRIFGQSYGGGDVSAELSLHNRFYPTIEVGIGSANNTPEDENFTYKSKMALYGKIGISYNVLYNKTTDYKFLIGFLVGYSSFKYDITNITVNSGYWDETSKFDILDQKSNALWGEIVLGLKVKIIQNFALGWSFRYRIMFDYKKNENSDPWYIPGFGSRTTPIGASFSLFYTIPLSHKKSVTKKVDAISKELAPPVPPLSIPTEGKVQ